MTRQLRAEQPSNDLSPAELGDFLRVQPPAFLDALVKQRVASVLERRRAELAEQGAGAQPGSDRSDARAPAQHVISQAEAWSYALGFLAYGAQLADGVARTIWHAMTG